MNETKIIEPTVGRVVHFYPNERIPVKGYEAGKPLAAIITHVWNDRMVNLCAFAPDGFPLSVTSVPLLQPDVTTEPPTDNFYCQWMPYQIKLDAKVTSVTGRFKE